MCDCDNIVTSGISSECAECLSEFGFSLEKRHFKVMVWEERDNLQIQLVDKATEQYTLIEYVDDDARMFVEDNNLAYGGKNPTEKILDCLWAEVRECDLLDNVPDEVFNASAAEDISKGKIFDEGSFSRAGCDICKNWLGQNLYVGHQDGAHIYMCADCLQDIG